MLDLGFLAEDPPPVEQSLEETSKALDEATKARAEARLYWWGLGGVLGGAAVVYFSGQPNTIQAAAGLGGGLAGVVLAKATAK